MKRFCFCLSCTLLVLMFSATAQNTNLDFLILGASMNYLYEGDPGMYISGDGRSYMIDLSPEYQSAYTNYLSWKSNNIDRLISDWTNSTLAASDEKYIRIIQADYLFRARYNRYGSANAVHCEQYFSSTEADGQAVLEKGYRAQPLTSNDWETLRVFRILDDIDNTGTEDLPSRLELSQHFTGEDWWDNGDATPVLQLPKLKTVLARTNYTDGVRIDPAAAFYERGSNRYARMMAAYTTNGAAPYAVTARDAAIPPGETGNDFAVIGGPRKKPLVVMPVQVSDAYWFRYNSHDLLPVFNAYRELVDFYIVQVQYHDVSAGQQEFLGAFAGKFICNMEPETSEEMAADAKSLFMADPWFNIPTLVDISGSRARNTLVAFGGDSYHILVDTNGTIAYASRRATWNNFQPNAEDFSGGTVWANVLEREILRVLNNNGAYVPTNITDQLAFEKSGTLALRRTGLISDATVDSINTESNRMTVSKTIGGTNCSFSLEIGPETRLSIREEAGKSLSAFSTGDTVTVKFWMDTYSSAGYSTNYNFTSIPGEYPENKREVRYEMSVDNGDGIIVHPRHINKDTTQWNLTRDVAWAVGTLESVSTDSRQVTVSLQADTNAMYGWKFWQEAGTNATLWGDGAHNLNVVSQWVESVQSESVWTFVIDDSVDIFINGENANYNDLRPGGRIGLLYRSYQNGSQTPAYPEQLRLSNPPVAPDDDSDGLPNAWEIEHFGKSTLADPSAAASNNINSIRQAYIAGLDPNDPNAKFVLSNVWNSLGWNTTSGRVYTIYWTSNLLESFQPLESNLVAGTYTDLLHNAQSRGFYKIGVQIAP